MKTKCTIEKASRQVIESKLLTSLTDSQLVAILATEEDLSLMIKALNGFTWGKRMAADFQTLREAAFPKVEQN